MKTDWNLKQLYKSINDPEIEKDIKTSEEAVLSFIKKWKKNKEYLKDPKVLKDALDQFEKLNENPGIYDKPIYYFSLLNSLNQTDPEIKGKLNKLSQLSTDLHNQVQFFELNISKVKKEQQEIFLKSPLLKEYRHYLESLFKEGEFLLTDKEEKVFNLMSKTSHSNWVNMVSELLSKQKLKVLDEEKKKFEISYNEAAKYLNSKQKEVRDYAAKEFNKVNERYVEIAEFEINSVLERKQRSDQYRKVPRPDLLRHIADDIESEVVDILLDVVSNNFNISQEYYKRKAKLLNQETLGYHERNVPLGKIEREYEYDESMELVKETFKNIDDSFYNIVKDLSASGQYDAFPKQNKNGGAFCITVSKKLPTFVMLNHNKKLNDVLTIAHESGHAIHSTMSKFQNSLNSSYPTSLAEVASTFFEDFVLEEILKDADDDLRFSILAEKLNSDISSIFRQVAFYNFEKDLHKEFRKSGYLSKKDISNIFCKHMSSYLGDAVEVDNGMKNGWIYWSHLRMFFYVYSYASGLLISKGLQSMVREEKNNTELVKEFLSSGSSKSPKDLFEGMGIDIMDKKFWKRGIKEIQNLLTKFN